MLHIAGMQATTLGPKRLHWCRAGPCAHPPKPRPRFVAHPSPPLWLKPFYLQMPLPPAAAWPRITIGGGPPQPFGLAAPGRRSLARFCFGRSAGPGETRAAASVSVTLGPAAAAAAASPPPFDRNDAAPAFRRSRRPPETEGSDRLRDGGRGLPLSATMGNSGPCGGKVLVRLSGPGGRNANGGAVLGGAASAAADAFGVLARLATATS